MSFSKPKIPAAPKPIPTPTRDEAKIAVDEQDRIRRRKGRASTLLTRTNRSRTSRASTLLSDSRSRTLLAKKDEEKSKLGM